MTGWYNGRNVHGYGIVHLRRMKQVIPEKPLRQEICSDSRDLAVAESVDRNWHSL